MSGPYKAPPGWCQEMSTTAASVAFAIVTESPDGTQKVRRSEDWRTTRPRRR